MDKKAEALGMTALDKFKRRMIRSVAGMLIHQKLPEKHVWDEMKKVMGYDCKILWDRMKCLTVKKLKRLLAADDRVEFIPVVARMTLTDWQLYDQILVHEDVDVIGLDTMEAKKSDSKVLIDLFALVQRFEIEMTIGDTLTEAWTAATLYYNSKGHQCSPMLLQKRWHQLKSETRRRFYNYWNTYRGSKRFVPNAEQYRPTILMRALAKRFPEVITHKFPDWETSIKDSLVILPDDFQRIKWNKNKQSKRPKRANTPDIVVVEPVIETIDLMHESDTEQEESRPKNVDVSAKHDAVTRVKIKVEPEDTADDYIAPVEKPSKTSTVIAQIQEEESLVDNIDDDINSLKAAENNLIHLAIDYESKLRDEDEEIEVEDIDNSTDNIPKITNVFGNAPLTDETLSMIENLAKKNTAPAVETEVTPAGQIEEGINEIDENSSTAIDLDDSNNEADSDVIKTGIATNTEDVETADDDDDVIVTGVENEANQNTSSNLSQLNQGNIDLSSFGEIPDNLHFADDGVECIDGGMELTEEREIKMEIEEEETNIHIKIENMDQATNPIENTSDPQEFKLDEKLFLDPVVYTQKLDDMCVLKDKPFVTVNDKILIKKIIDESKPISDRSVDAEKAWIDKHKVSVTSYMFKKPKHRDYNPITLCKNPDFNTRLKRLTAGFLSSSQNRAYLKECMPLTIDLTKAFESKLINNTVYLKKPDNTRVIKIEEDEAKTVTVIPSANPIESIIHNTPTNDDLKYSNNDSQPTTSRVGDNTGRYKTIHLPDIIQIRRINQTLLTAEISPMPIQRKNSNQDSPNIRSRETSLQRDLFAEHHDSIISPTSGNSDAIRRDASRPGSLSNMMYAPRNGPNDASQNNKSNRLDAINVILASETQAKKRQQVRIPWRPMYNSSMIDQWWNKKVKSASDIDEFLITKDTLDKMLCLFNGEIPDDSQKKSKKKRIGRPIDRTNIENKKAKPDAPKISQDVPPPLIPIFRQNMLRLEQEAQKKKENPTESTANRAPNVITRICIQDNADNTRNLYCCWAREQLVQKQTNSHKRGKIHNCPYMKCTCCCAAELDDYKMDKTRPSKRRSRQQSVPKPAPRETRDAEAQTIEDESDGDNTMAVLETVVLENDDADVDIVEENITNTPIKDDCAKTNRACGDVVKPSFTETNATLNIVTKLKQLEVSVSPSNDEEIVRTDVDVIETVVTENVLSRLSPLEDITVPTISNVYSLNSAASLKPLVNKPNIAVTATPSVGSPSPVANIIVSITKTDPPTENKPIHKDNIVLPSLTQIPKQNRAMSITRKIKPSGLKLNPKRIKSDMLKVTAGPNNKGRILVLNDDRKTVPISCPVFLGRNKILLTNIKFPEYIAKETQSLLKTQQLNSYPQVPKGVQLVLLADGKLKYLATSGYQFNSETGTIKSPLISTTQQSMATLSVNTSTKMSNTDGEVVDISDDETVLDVEESPGTDGSVYSIKNAPGTSEELLKSMSTDKKSLYSNEKVIELDDENEPANNLGESESSSEIITNSTYTEGSDKLTVDSPMGNKNTTNKSIDQNKDIKTVESTSPTNTETMLEKQTAVAENCSVTNSSVMDASANIEASNSNSAEKLEANNENTPILKKTILSDLMEMSGISTEDAAPAEVQARQEDVIPVQDELDLNTPVHSTSAVPNANSPVPTAATTPTTTIVNQTHNPVQLIHELSTVTSFPELRYACEKGGVFFKLDFETGVVSPIQVTFRRGPRPMEMTKHIRIAPKETIDLTEEIDFNHASAKTIPSKNIEPEKTAASNPKSIKPITIFKSVQRPRILRLPDTEQHKTSIIRNEVDNVEYRVTTSPTVVQYPPKRSKRKTVQKVQVLSESSDEEPLSVKAKKKRNELAEQDTKNITGVNEVVGNDSTFTAEDDNQLSQHSLPNQEDNTTLEHAELCQNNNQISQDTESVGEIQLGNPMSGQEANQSSEVTPIPGSLVLAEDDASPRTSPEPVFQYEASSDGNEDCILGV